MKSLTPPERRALRAKAHHLHPVVAIGQHGLTPAVLHEIDVALLAHELVKIRVFGDVRADREALLERICAEMDAAPVQHLGKVLTLWRPKPPPEAVAKIPRPERGARRPQRAPATAVAGAAAGRRAGKGGKPPQERRRAPPTAKGPFEPGKRTARAQGGPGSGSGERNPRRPAAAPAGKPAGSARRRPTAGLTRPAEGTASPSRRRRRQP
jgi:RNA-binding protein